MAFIKRKFNELIRKVTKDKDYPEMDYFLNESSSDVVFVIDGYRVPAIKSILGLKSRVFRAMFSENFCESKESEKSKLPEILVKDTTVDAFKTLIRFIYTEVLEFKDQNDWLHIWDVYQLSDRYEVLRLRDRAVHRLESIINVSNVLSITRVVFTLKVEDLMAKVMAFIASNITELIRNDINGLTELNDLTDDKVFDVMTTKFLDSNSHTISLWYGTPPNCYYINTEGITSEALKTFIRLLYFDKLVLKDNDDFQLIREVCRLCNKYNKFSPLLASIGTYLEERITDENSESISGIASDYRIDGLIEKVNEMKI